MAHSPELITAAKALAEKYEPRMVTPYPPGRLEALEEMALEALTTEPKPEWIAPMDDRPAYLITKGGAYYRPNAEGYTRDKSEAGRFTLAEAESHSHPNGPGGPRDGISYEPAPSGVQADPAAGKLLAELRLMNAQWFADGGESGPPTIRGEMIQELIAHLEGAGHDRA